MRQGEGGGGDRQSFIFPKIIGTSKKHIYQKNSKCPPFTAMNYHQNRKFEKNIKNVALENKTNLKSNCDGDLKIPAQYVYIYLGNLAGKIRL